ncbi:MAG: NAD(P)-dependent alcohol dehydrogenase [Acidimicrobiia bacterium]
MRAVVHDRFGPPEVLRIEDVPAPVPKDDEVLVRVRATTVSQTDCHVRRARPIVWRFMIGFFRPKWRTLGMEFAGEIEAVGSAVTKFAVGDRVFGMKNYGANAELVTARESRLVAHLPEAMSFEEGAAVIDGGFQGLLALRRGGVGKGTRLLVYGASGSCGTACVQLGRHLGAHVTAVCGTKNVELMRSLGADIVIDYQREDFRKRGEKYDVIVDAVGKIVGMRYRGSLVRGGRFVLTDGFLNVVGVLLTRFSSRRIVASWPRYDQEDLLLLKRLLETGEYRAVIDRVYPLERIVEATAFVETWQKTGNVVLTLDGGSN